MKKQAINVLTVCFLCTGISFSQNISLGIVGGPNRTFLWGPEFAQPNIATNYMAGISAEYSFNRSVSILALSTYDVKGNGFDINLTDQNGNIIGTFRMKNKLNYFTVPLLVQGKFGTKVRVLVNAGPYFSYLVNARFAGAGTPDTFNSMETTDHFKRLDLGASFGVGAEFPVTKRLDFTVMLSNNVGVYDISKREHSPGAIKNNSTSLLLGLNYALSDLSNR